MNGSTQRDEPSPRERRESADSSEPPGARHGEQPHHASRRTPRTSPPDRVLPSEAAGSSFHLSGLVAEILERRDRGEGVSVHDLEERFPERSEEIEDVLSVIELVEHAGAVRAGRAVENAEAPMEIGDFDIVREIGRGGMGVVYEAVQKSVSRTVALKVLPGDRFRDESRIERFRREVQSLARLEHPNVVQVYAAGRDNGAHFFAMRLVRGCGLDEVLRALQESEPGKSAPPGSDADSSRGSRPKADVREVAAALFGPVRAMAPSRSVLEIVRQVADALEYCHSRGVIHRDVKPSNILVDAAGHVCLTDFGLAKEEGCEGVTRTGDVVGTLAYLAPEALRGWSDPRSDVYGLGVTLYEILTRRRAFEHSDTHVLLQQIAENDPPRPRVLNPEIPRDLETIVLHAIEKEPARRYATAGELARDLQAHLESRVISVRRRTALERTWLWCRRNRAVAAGLGLAALALVAITVGAVVFGLRERRIAEEQRSLATEKRSFSDYQAQKIRQLGVEQERIGAERDAAKADLFRSLIGQARALRIARQPGYRVEADALLRRALDLDAAKTDADLRAVRDEVVASLGDWIGFEPTVSLDVELPARRKDPEAPAPILERLAAKVSGELLHQVLEDGTIAFTDTDGGWISLWRAGRVVRTHDLRRFRVTGVRQLALSPDGRLLALACKGGVGLLILGTGALYVHGQFPGDVVEGVSFDPTGRYLAATLAGGAGAEVYDVLAMRPVVRLPAPSGTEKFEFCGEGRLLVAVHRERRPLGAWTVGETPERTVLGGHRAGVTSIAWRPSGGHFATCSEDGTVKVWDAESGRVAADLRCLSGTRRDVAFSPDGELLVAVGRAPKIQVWDAEDGRQLGQLECRAAIGDLRALAFDPGGKYLVAMGEEELVVIGVKRAPGGVLLDEALVTRTRALRDLAIAPTRTDIFVTHGEPSRLARLDLLDRGRLCPLGTDRSRVLDSLHFDASGRLLMARDTSSRVQVIDWQEAARGRRQGAGQRVVAAGLEDLVPTSNLEFVSGLAGDITPALFSLKDDREIVRLPPERNTISCQRLRGDGDLLVLGLANGNVILWRLSEVWRRLESFGWKEAPAARPPSRLAVRPAPDALVETALGALGDVQELEVVVAGSQGRTSHLFRPDEAVHFVANAPQGTPDGAVDELFWDFGDGETTVRRRAGAEHAYSRAGVYRVFVSSRTARGSSRVVVADDPAALGKEFRVLHSWDFEKGAEDSVGAHHARLHAGARVAGGALRLDGKDDCASIPVDRFFAERVSLSIEAWVSSGGETPRPGRRILHMSSGPSRYAFLAARPFFRLRYRAPPTKAASLYPVRSLDYASGEPQHVVVTVDGEQLSWRIYLNGQLEGTREGRPACCLGSTAWNWIGRSQGRDLFLPAAVHALRFYDGALSPEVIALLHLRGPDAPRFVGMANDVPGESPRIEGGESPVRAGSVLEFRVRGLHDGDAAREDERTGNHATTETGPRPEPERAWDFADGDTATGAVVRHTYSHPGLYDVLLKAAGPGRFRVARRLVRVVAEHNPEAVLAVNFAADEPRNLHLGSEVAGLAGRLGSSAWTNVRGAAGEASGLRAMLDGRTVETVARVAWSSADTGDAVRALGFRNRAPASDDYRLMSGCLVGIGKTESGESKPIRIDLDGLSAVFGEHRYDLWVYVLGPDEGQTGDLVAGGIRVEHTTGSPFDGAYREGEDVIAFRGLSGDACKLVATPTARESGARVFVSAIEVSRSPEGERES